MSSTAVIERGDVTLEGEEDAANRQRPARQLLEEPNRRSRASHWRLAAVLVAGLAVRLLLVAWLHGEGLNVADERDYDALAVNLVDYGEYGFGQGQLSSLRPPVFPALVAGLYKVGGEHNFTLVRMVNALLGVLIAYVVYWMARRLYDEKTGLLAAAICAFYPSLVAVNGLVLTETLFTLLMVTSCVLFERYLTTSSLGWLAAFGATLALASLTRSVLWLFPGPLVLFLLVWAPAPRFSTRCIHAAVALLAFAIVMAPWTVRNTRLQKTFVTVDVMGGRNVMMGNYEHTPFHRPWAAIEIEGPEAWHQLVRQRFPEESQGVTQGQLDKLAVRYAAEYMRAHPLETLQRDVAKFFHFWQLEREVVAGLVRGYWGNVPKAATLVIAAALLGSYVVVMLLGVFGAAAAIPANWRMHAFLWLLMAFVCGLHTLAFGHSRYHLPLMPLVGMFAAAAWVNRQSLLSRWKQPAVVLAAAFSLVLVVYWCGELLVEAGRF